VFEGGKKQSVSKTANKKSSKDKRRDQEDATSVKSMEETVFQKPHMKSFERTNFLKKVDEEEDENSKSNPLSVTNKGLKS